MSLMSVILKSCDTQQYVGNSLEPCSVILTTKLKSLFKYAILRAHHLTILYTCNLYSVHYIVYGC